MKRLLCFVALLAVCCASYAQIVRDMVDEIAPLSAPQVEQLGKTARITVVGGPITNPFTGVAVQGLASGDSLKGWIRFAEGEAWKALYIVRSATDDAFLGAYRGEEVLEAKRFELRFEAESVTLLDAGVFDSRADGLVPRSEAHKRQGENFVIHPPALIRRRTWGAQPFIGTPTALNRPRHEYMTLHHTAGFAATTRDEGLEQVRRIQDFHQNGRGWSDIGYHFLMDQEGRLYQGRPFLHARTAFEDGPPLVLGAHVGGQNTGNIGVSLMGCYHPAEGSHCRHAMTAEAADSVLVMFAYLSERYDIAPDALRGHRDFGATACPGDNNYALLPGMRLRIDDLLRTGNAPLGTVAFKATADSIGVVIVKWDFYEDNGIDEYSIERIVGDRETVLFREAGALDGWIVDTEASGAVAYTLTARGSGDKIQVLGRAEVTLTSPELYVLAQNYPNPFADKTTIRYFLEQAGIVTVDVYDVGGRRVASLEQPYRDEGQWHSATFDASALPGGVYFYYMQLEGFSDVRYKAARPLVILR